MTKSFTATMVLTLRDEGALGLDDLAEQYVPELKGWPPVTPDAQRVRIRHLLTMTAGFPTDDPWGDREQGTPLPEFAEFLAQGVSFAWAPGYPVRVLEPGLRDPGPGHLRRDRRALRGRDQGPAARPAGDVPDRL